MSAANQPGDDLSILKSGETAYPQSPDAAVLETFANAYPDRNYTIHFHCPEFTALCPITGQPDFATIDIDYVAAERCVESKSLKLYLFSFRNEGSFGEQIANRILEDLVTACAPRSATVTAVFTPRGGIHMRVVAEHPDSAG